MLSSITSRGGSIAAAACRGTRSICKPTSNASRNLSSSQTKATITRRTVSAEERAALRKERKKQSNQQATAASAAESSTSSNAASSSSTGAATKGKPMDARLIFGLGVGIPTILLTWGVYDPNSPPARIASSLGFDEVYDSFAKPNEEKLLPNWHDMPDVPKEFQPMTLVIDLENTLVHSTWDRKHGWRTAKRPGAVKFLRELAQYYEIVLFTPSQNSVALPIIEALQIESGGAIMHSKFREACHYRNGIYVKDMTKLNRNISRVIVIDDDESTAISNLENFIKVKPYTDPSDRKDNTLERIMPLLVEIATENYNDARVVLSQFRGMDADEIADVLEERVERLQNVRRNKRGLGSWSAAGKADMPKPEMTPVDRSRKKPAGISSKDIVGGANAPGGAKSSAEDAQGVSAWLQRRQEQQAKEKMEKMEHWNKLMMERSEQKRQNEASS